MARNWLNTKPGMMDASLMYKLYPCNLVTSSISKAQDKIIMFSYFYSSAVSLLIAFALVAHIIRTGRNMIWIAVVIFVPGIGSLIYFLVEILPDLLRGRAARRAKSALRGVVD